MDEGRAGGGRVAVEEEEPFDGGAKGEEALFGREVEEGFASGEAGGVAVEDEASFLGFVEEFLNLGVEWGKFRGGRRDIVTLDVTGIGQGVALKVDELLQTLKEFRGEHLVCGIRRGVLAGVECTDVAEELLPVGVAHPLCQLFVGDPLDLGKSFDDLEDEVEGVSVLGHAGALGGGDVVESEKG
jgi:hypothetical protein